MKASYQAREPIVDLNGSLVAVQVAQTASESSADQERYPGSSGFVFRTEKGMNELQVRKSCETSTSDVEASDAAADH